MECLPLDELKKDYKKLQEKHSLPEFDKLAEDFDVEKAQEKETSFLLRDIRRAMNEKLSSYLHLFETFINPTSPPMFVFSLLKNADEKDKELMKKMYKEFSKVQIDMLKLDTIYNEEKEAAFIKDIFEKWQDLKKEISGLLEKLDKDFDLNNNQVKRGYFG